MKHGTPDACDDKILQWLIFMWEKQTVTSCFTPYWKWHFQKLVVLTPPLLSPFLYVSLHFSSQFTSPCPSSLPLSLSHFSSLPQSHPSPSPLPPSHSLPSFLPLPLPSTYIHTYHDGPSPHFIVTTGEETLEIEGLVACSDDLPQCTEHRNTTQHIYSTEVTHITPFAFNHRSRFTDPARIR